MYLANTRINEQVFAGFRSDEYSGNAHGIPHVQSQQIEWNNGITGGVGRASLGVKINRRCFNVDVANHFLKT
jgi:hypothetical protein